MKHILFTFDYELYLGEKSGTAENCVLEPTRRIEDILNYFGCNKSIYFVDLLWLWREIEHDSKSEVVNNVRDQLTHLAQNGSYIFPHLHTHWLDAKRTHDGQWNLSNLDKYRFHDLKNDERVQCLKFARNVFEDSLGFKLVDLGFRAGGWSLQPIEDYVTFFSEWDIKYDFSILPGHRSLSNAQWYDFTLIESVTPFSLAHSNRLTNSSINMTALPISTLEIQRNWKHKLLSKVLWKLGDRGSGNGSAVGASVSESRIHPTEMASIELMDIFSIKDYLKFLETNDYLQIISHPKMVSKHNLKALTIFLKQVKKEYEVNYDFKRLPFPK